MAGPAVLMATTARMIAGAVEETFYPRNPLDVLAQHVLGMACADAFDPVALHDEIRRAWPYRNLDWETFERVVDFSSCLHSHCPVSDSGMPHLAAWLAASTAA